METDRHSFSNSCVQTALKCCAVALVLCGIALPAPAQVSVLTHHYDNSRTGQNTNETILTPANVNSTQFGKLFTQSIDGQVYAQPLYVPGVTIPGKGTHNVVLVATESASLYAFDADSNAGANSTFLWKVSLIDAAHGAAADARPVTSAQVGCPGGISPNIGTTSTPVIDANTGTIYVDAASYEGGTFVHRLHAIDIATGAEKFAGPVVITATVNGTGDGSSGGTVTFNPLTQLSRAGLLLLNGTVYMAFASYCDNGPYHGWVIAYDAGTLTRTGALNLTPNGGLGGIWMSGAGLAADAAGNLYLATGNGTFDTAHIPATEWGDSIVKLAFNGGNLSVLDYFTPYNQGSLDSADLDLGSGGVLLLPDQPGNHAHLLVQTSKAGTIYVLDRDQLTANNLHYCITGCNSSNPQIAQELKSAVNGTWSMPAYWNNNVYIWGNGDFLKAFSLTNGLLSSSFTSKSNNSLGYPGATPIVSSNGAANGIVWALRSANTSAAVLYAYDATDVSRQLYNSSQAPSNRDVAGTGVKFTVPVVANGKVYVGTATELDVYGLFGGGTPQAAAPSFSPSGGTYGTEQTPSLTRPGTLANCSGCAGHKDDVPEVIWAT